MTSSSSAHALRGLARSIHQLFDADTAWITVHEGTPVVYSPWGHDVAWVAESGVRLPGDMGVPDPLIGAVQAYLTAPQAGQDAARMALQDAVESARQRKAVPAMADAAEALAAFARRNPEALELARDLVSPGVATLLVARLRDAAGSERRRDELLATLPLLGGEVEDAVLAALREEASDPRADRAVRRSYLRVVRTMADRGSDILGRMLDEPDWRVLRNAVRLVGDQGGEEEVPRLRKILEHQEPRVRKEALAALAKRGGEEVGVLARARLGDPDPRVRAQAARTVGRLGLEAQLQPLIDLLETESDERVLVEAIRALGVLGDSAAVPHLEKRVASAFFERSSQQVRVATYRALAAIGSPRALKLIQGGLTDRDPEVRHTSETLVRRPA